MMGHLYKKLDSLDVTLDYDPNQYVATDGLLYTTKLTSKAIQLNFAIRSEMEENTFQRTLLIKDKCTGSYPRRVCNIRRNYRRR